ncbi:hypothetical protein DFJ74DRAFT_478692 [Hyaloraphidium curvatum]|nr:hypothetical protein DFJ74DRAFT_478692 [Hyaloraphidium curvatum]
MDYRPALEVCVAAARAAGALLRAEFHRAGGPRGTLSSAGSHGAKAAADDASEDLIRRALADSAPCGAWTFVGEESGSHGAPAEHVVVCDPNDGTSHFLKAERGSAVSIGVLRGGQPVLGVVYAFGYPDDAGDLVAWAEGCPLTRNGKEIEAPKLGDIASFDAAPSSSLPRMIALVPRSVDHRRQPVAPFLGLPYVSLPSVAYRLARLACGDGALCISLHGLSSWDVIAGHALVRAAGGTLMNDRGVEVTYAPDGRFADPSMGASRSFFAGPRAAVARLLQDRSPQFAELLDFIRSRKEVPRDPALRLIPAVPKSLRCPDPAKLSRVQGALLGLVAGGGAGDGLLLARSLVHAKSWSPAFSWPDMQQNWPSRAAVLGIFGSLLPSATPQSAALRAGRDCASKKPDRELPARCRAVAAAVCAGIQQGTLMDAAEAAARELGKEIDAGAGDEAVVAAIAGPDAPRQISDAVLGAVYGLARFGADVLVGAQTFRDGPEGGWTADVLELAEALAFGGRTWDDEEGGS